MSNSVDPDEMAHELSHLDLCRLQKPIIIAYGSERSANHNCSRQLFSFSTIIGRGEGMDRGRHGTRYNFG